MRRLATLDVAVAVVLGLWVIAGVALVAPLFEREAQAVIVGGNACLAPLIPGLGCPAFGNGCAGCAGTGWNCQAAIGACLKGPAGCSSAGPPPCRCSPGSC